MRRTTPRPRGLAALVRRWWPDRNPLRRAADRAEAVVLALLLLMFLAGAPLAALAASHGVSAASARAERAQAGWRRVPAVLQRSAPQQAHTRFQASLERRVPARWTAPDGSPRTGMVYAPSGSRAGSTVMVWTDRSGQESGLPLQPVDVASRMALAASLAAVGVAALAGGAGLLARRALDRRRLAAWDARWSETGPQWTGRRLPGLGESAAVAVVFAPHRPALGAHQIRPAGSLAALGVGAGAAGRRQRGVVGGAISHQ